MPDTQRSASFIRFFGPLDAAPNYSWLRHLLLVSPLIGLLAWITIHHGWWGQPVYDYFSGLRLEYPTITASMRLVTDTSAWLLYGMYALLMAKAVYTKDNASRIFVFRYILGALIFVVLITQTIKVCSGMPRPGYDLVPNPFTFAKEYSTFPSGHTVDIVCAALPLAFWFRGSWVSLTVALLIALVAFSRLWISAHHPVDVAVALVVGSAGARYVSCSRAYVQQFAASWQECLHLAKRLLEYIPRWGVFVRKKKEI